MDDKDKLRFEDTMAAMVEVFAPQKKAMSAAGLRMYFEALKCLSYDQFMGAAIELMKTWKFNTMPTPAQILECAGYGANAKAMLAWDRVLYAIDHHAFYGDSVQFEDPRITAIVKSHGGWVNVCKKSDDELNTWFRKSFISEYVAMHLEPNNERLIGYSELHRRKPDGNYNTVTIACDYLNPAKAINGTPDQLKIARQ